MTAIRIDGLSKRYGKKTAVDGISLEIEKGELFALLGVNGAGKTTTVKMLSGLVLPDGGDAEILGYKISKDIKKIKEFIAVSPQESAVAPNLTVFENLELMASLHSDPERTAKERSEKMIKELSLGSVRNKKAKNLSGGYVRRLSIAMALICEPSVLFLDEPTLGLDVLARRELWRLIKALKGEVTVILTTHYLEEAEALSDRLCIMKDGRIIASGTAAEIISSSGEKSLEDAFVKMAGDCGGGAK